MADDRAYRHDLLDDATIARYLSGTCEPAERARVERWAEADPANRAELAALQVAWNPAPVGQGDQDDRMWRWIAARMDAPMARPTVVPASRPSSRTYTYARRIGAAAAAIALLVGGAILISLPQRSLPFRAGVPAAHTQMRELATPRGARVTSNLPDGTRVVLAPDSRLLVPATFAAATSVRGSRDVYLQSGEAFFEVTHDAKRPFRVHTPTGIAEDLGTEFVVSAYPETGATRVVVASGVVALRGSDTGATHSVTLRAGDLGRIGALGVATLTRNVDVAAYIGWTTGTLVFDDVPLGDAIIRLSRWYDVDIRLADTAMTGQRFTATFHDESISQVLPVLEVALGVRAERRGDVVVLRPR